MRRILRRDEMSRTREVKQAESELKESKHAERDEAVGA